MSCYRMRLALIFAIISFFAQISVFSFRLKYLSVPIITSTGASVQNAHKIEYCLSPHTFPDKARGINLIVKLNLFFQGPGKMVISDL